MLALLSFVDVPMRKTHHLYKSKTRDMKRNTIFAKSTSLKKLVSLRNLLLGTKLLTTLRIQYVRRPIIMYDMVWCITNE